MTETDPLVAVLSWLLTWGAGRWGLAEEHRGALPFVALLVAVAARGAIDATSGLPLTLATVASGLWAGACAIVMHDTARGAAKVATARRDRRER